MIKKNFQYLLIDKDEWSTTNNCLNLNSDLYCKIKSTKETNCLKNLIINKIDKNCTY